VLKGGNFDGTARRIVRISWPAWIFFHDFMGLTLHRKWQLGGRLSVGEGGREAGIGCRMRRDLSVEAKDGERGIVLYCVDGQKSIIHNARLWRPVETGRTNADTGSNISPWF